MQFIHSAFFEGQGAVWLAALCRGKKFKWLKVRQTWEVIQRQKQSLSGDESGTQWHFGAILWTHLCSNTNLEILVFVSVAVMHMSFQFPRIEETLRAARELTPAKRTGRRRRW